MKNWLFLVGCLTSSSAMAELKELKNARLLNHSSHAITLAGDLCSSGRCTYQEIRLVNNGSISIDGDEDRRLTWEQFKQTFNGRAYLFYTSDGKIDRVAIPGGR